MSEFKIKRKVRNFSITLGTATADATVLRTDDMAGGVVSVGTMSTSATSLQVWGAHDEVGPYRKLYKADGSAATITLSPSTVDGRVYAMPDEVFALPFVLLACGSTHSAGTIGMVTLKS